MFRSDTEANAAAADIIAFDRQVTGQAGREFNMPSDRPGVLMRRMLAARLAATAA